MTKTTLTTSGNYRFIRIAGNPADVAKLVNRWFNFGILPTIPESFKPGESANVFAQSYRANVQAGFEALVASEIREGKRHLPPGIGQRPKLISRAIKAKAREMISLIPRERVTAERAITHIPTLETGEGEDAISPELRAKGRELIAGWFGRGVRDSVSARPSNREE